LNPEQGEHASHEVLRNTSAAKEGGPLMPSPSWTSWAAGPSGVGEHTARRNSDASQEFVELLVIAHGKLHMAWDDARFLVAAGSVAGELEDLGSEVLEHGSEVHGRASTDAYLPCLRKRCTRPTGNWRPAFLERETDLPPLDLPQPAAPLPALPDMVLRESADRRAFYRLS